MTPPGAVTPSAVTPGVITPGVITPGKIGACPAAAWHALVS
jgi:hypothetical protein